MNLELGLAIIADMKKKEEGFPKNKDISFVEKFVLEKIKVMHEILEKVLDKKQHPISRFIFVERGKYIVGDKTLIDTGINGLWIEQPKTLELLNKQPVFYIDELNRFNRNVLRPDEIMGMPVHRTRETSHSQKRHIRLRGAITPPQFQILEQDSWFYSEAEFNFKK